MIVSKRTQQAVTFILYLRTQMGAGKDQDLLAVHSKTID